MIAVSVRAPGSLSATDVCPSTPRGPLAIVSVIRSAMLIVDETSPAVFINHDIGVLHTVPGFFGAG